MRGKKRTKEEKNELFKVLEDYLKMGFSLKKACSYAELPYSTIRDVVSIDKPLRARTTALQNLVNVSARANIIKSIESGNIKDSKWWLEKFDHLESQDSPEFGGFKEGLLTYAEFRKENADDRAIEFINFTKEMAEEEVVGS